MNRRRISSTNVHVRDSEGDLVRYQHVELPEQDLILDRRPDPTVGELVDAFAVAVAEVAAVRRAS